MPRVLGVIAEYNPFHNGHAYHLARARQAAGADYVVVVMSACFTQRGDAAIVSPHLRAEMALHCGADAVVALPSAWAARDAEHFALGGVSLLSAVGCNAISFGSECADANLLSRTACMVNNPSASFMENVKRHLQTGLPYPAAVATAAEADDPQCAAILRQPNATLALCYLRAMDALPAQMEIIPITRSGSYHATSLTDSSPSATALRGAILRGDWNSVRNGMPEAAYELLMRAAAEGHIHRPDALDTALLARLRTMSDEDYAVLPDVSEGVEHRLHAASQAACTRDDLLHTAKTRRYPYARLSRLATHALLGFTHKQLAEMPPPTEPWLLGYRLDARPLIAHIASRTPLITRAADLLERPWFEAERRAWDLWALGASLPAGLAQSARIVTI